MPYAGVVLHKQNKYMDLFNSMDAIDKEHAISLECVNIKRDSIFDKMLGIGVFTECEYELFFMNGNIAEKLKKNRSGFHLWRLEKNKQATLWSSGGFIFSVCLAYPSLFLLAFGCCFPMGPAYPAKP